MDIWIGFYVDLTDFLNIVLYRLDWYWNTVLYRLDWYLNSVLCRHYSFFEYCPIQTWLVLEYCPIYTVDWYLFTVIRTWWIFGYCPILSLKNPHGFGDWISFPFQVVRWERGPAVLGPREKASLPIQWPKIALSTGPTRVGFSLTLCLKKEKSVLLRWGYFCPEGVYIIQNVSLLN